jgi:hypothetical protein
MKFLRTQPLSSLPEMVRDKPRAVYA